MPDDDIEYLIRGLVATAVLAADPGPLERAEATATATRDRQLVVIARAHLDGDGDRLDALVRDHLAEYPDSLFAAWIAERHAIAERQAIAERRA